jgi:hypothetical protein
MTRAEVAESKPDAAAGGKPAAPGIGAPSEIPAAAERLQDLAWALRERGLELATCDQIEAIARILQSASALHDPSDRRARRLGEALQYLERRIGAMLDAKAAGAEVSTGSAAAGDGADAHAGTATAVAQRAPASPLASGAMAGDPLAALKAMSEEERLALFT